MSNSVVGSTRFHFLNWPKRYSQLFGFRISCEQRFGAVQDFISCTGRNAIHNCSVSALVVNSVSGPVQEYIPVLAKMLFRTIRFSH